MRSSYSTRSWLALLALAPWGCSQGGQATPQAVHAATPPGSSLPDETLLRLDGASGSPEALWGDASYKIKRKGGKRIRKLEIDVGNAAPGVAHVVTLDGLELGELLTNRKGGGEFKLSEEDNQLFPAGFQEPRAGSLLRVGELMELHLDVLEKLADLEAPISGPGGLSGKIGFEIERLGSTVTREFQIKVEKAPVKTTHPVSLDGVHVGDMSVDVEGQGKLKFSTKKSPPFPAAFPEPHAGSVVRVGDLFQGELVDALAHHP